jgi:hypothetical protein
VKEVLNYPFLPKISTTSTGTGSGAGTCTTYKKGLRRFGLRGTYWYRGHTDNPGYSRRNLCGSVQTVEVPNPSVDGVVWHPGRLSIIVPMNLCPFLLRDCFLEKRSLND